MRELVGWTESSLYKERARKVVEEDVMAPLARDRIRPDPERLGPLL